MFFAVLKPGPDASAVAEGAPGRPACPRFLGAGAPEDSVGEFTVCSAPLAHQGECRTGVRLQCVSVTPASEVYGGM